MARVIADVVLASMTVWMEARGEPYEGKIAVAEVIVRRMTRKVMSDGTVVGTILRPHQFSGWNTQDPNRLAVMRLDDTTPSYLECVRAWNDAVGGVSVVPEAVFYFAPAQVATPPMWATRDKWVKTIGQHQFYAM